MNKKLKPHILVVDDEADIRELLKISLMRMGANVTTVDDVQAAKDQLQSHMFDLVFTDMNLAEDDGLEIVQLINSKYPAIPCAVITAYGDMHTAVKALHNGAYDFVAKPIEKKLLQKLFDTGLKLSKTYDWGKIKQEKLIGDSELIKNITKLIQKSAESDVSTLITGPVGTGKRLIAKLIQRAFAQSDKPLTIFNLATVNFEQVEKNLFGDVNESGVLENANGGTLLINEIDKLSLKHQAQLAEVLASNQLTTSKQTIGLKLKLITTSNHNLPNLVEKELFNSDLFYHINVLTITTCELIKNKQDIPLLVDYFLSELTQFSHLETPGLSDAAMQALLNYEFPGNVRELETILQRAIALCENNIIQKNDLQLQQSNEVDSSQTKIDTMNALPVQLEDIEKQRIVKALENNRWNKTAAAKELGISFRALRYRIQKLDIK